MVRLRGIECVDPLHVVPFLGRELSHVGTEVSMLRRDGAHDACHFFSKLYIYAHCSNPRNMLFLPEMKICGNAEMEVWI